MSERVRADALGWLALWLAIALAVMFLRMLPLHVGPDGWPSPDLFLALTMGWVLRRPQHLPAVAIGLVWLLEDLLTLRPPGLWALMVLAGTEFLRARHAVVREINLPLEWAMVAGVMVAMWLANRAILVIVMVPNAALDLSLIQLVSTVALYPVAVFVLRFVLRVRKPATGELDELGRRL
jgi:rod shape-determining protein MreD